MLNKGSINTCHVNFFGNFPKLRSWIVTKSRIFTPNWPYKYGMFILYLYATKIHFFVVPTIFYWINWKNIFKIQLFQIFFSVGMVANWFSVWYRRFAGDVFKYGVKRWFAVKSGIVANSFNGILVIWICQHSFHSIHPIRIYKLKEIF